VSSLPPHFLADQALRNVEQDRDANTGARIE
jgi:hypothetical protein